MISDRAMHSQNQIYYKFIKHGGTNSITFHTTKCINSTPAFTAIQWSKLQLEHRSTWRRIFFLIAQQTPSGSLAPSLQYFDDHLCIIVIITYQINLINIWKYLVRNQFAIFVPISAIFFPTVVVISTESMNQ